MGGRGLFAFMLALIAGAWNDLFHRSEKPVFRKEYPWDQRWRIPVERAGGKTPNKAYADQRQKAPWNRRRKPSKAMRNLYKLS